MLIDQLNLTAPSAWNATLKTELRMLAAGYWPVPIHAAGCEIMTRQGLKIATGKEPIGPAWGVTRRTRPWLEAKARQFPDHGVGMLFGPGAHAQEGDWLIDLECDGPRAAESLRRLGVNGAISIGWDATRGYHLIFVAEGETLLDLLSQCRAEKRTGFKVGVYHLLEYPDLEWRIGGPRDRWLRPASQTSCHPPRHERPTT